MRCRLKVLVALKSFLSKSRPSRGVLSEPSKAHSLGDEVGDYREVVVPLVPVHLIGSHSHQTVKAQPLMRSRHAGDEHVSDPRFSLAGDLTGTLDGHITRQGYCELTSLPPLSGRVLTFISNLIKPLSRRALTTDYTLLRPINYPTPQPPGATNIIW